MCSSKRSLSLHAIENRIRASCYDSASNYNMNNQDSIFFSEMVIEAVKKTYPLFRVAKIAERARRRAKSKSEKRGSQVREGGIQ